GPASELPTPSGLARAHSVGSPPLAARWGSARKTSRRPVPGAFVARLLAGRVVTFCIRFPPPIDAVGCRLAWESRGYAACGKRRDESPRAGHLTARVISSAPALRSGVRDLPARVASVERGQGRDGSGPADD